MGREDVGPPTGQAAQKEAAGGGGCLSWVSQRPLHAEESSYFQESSGLDHRPSSRPQNQLLAGVQGKHLSPGAAEAEPWAEALLRRPGLSWATSQPQSLSETLGKCPTCLLGFPVAQLVKNLPAVWETWVQFLGWRREGYPLQYSGLENPMDCIVHGAAKSRT